MSTASLQWRPMRASDLSSVNDIADEVHVNYPESPEIPAERLALYPRGCFVLDLNGRASGYIVSHAWRFGHAPKLNSLLGRIENPDILYLHDLALLPSARGHGLGAGIVKMLSDLARQENLKAICGVAVNNSVPFWKKQGFVVEQEGAPDLSSYGDDARYVVYAADSDKIT